LEKTINMLKRYAYALGIQEGGILYEEVMGLARKYKMGDYEPPTGYSYDELTRPDVSIPLPAVPEQKQISAGEETS
jgi:hypothetical protein